MRAFCAIMLPVAHMLSVEVAMAADGPKNKIGNITGNSGIITQGQIGNNIIINQAPVPQIRVVAWESTRAADGGYLWTAKFEIVADTAPNSIEILAEPRTTDLKVTGGGAYRNWRDGGRRAGF